MNAQDEQEYARKLDEARGEVVEKAVGYRRDMGFATKYLHRPGSCNACDLVRAVDALTALEKGREGK